MLVGPPRAAAGVSGAQAALVNQRNRVNLKSLGEQLLSALGQERHEKYMSLLRVYLTAKLSKREFEGKVVQILGPENVSLHNALVGALLHNARVTSSMQSTKVMEQHKRTVLEENNQKKMHPMGREARGRRRLPQQGSSTPMTPSSAGGPSMDLGDGSAVAGLGSGMDLDAAAGAGAGSAGALSSDSQIFSRGINSLRDLGIKSRRGYEMHTVLDTQDDFPDRQAMKVRVDGAAMESGLDIRRVPSAQGSNMSDLDEVADLMSGAVKAVLKNVLETSGAWSRARHDVLGDPEHWTPNVPVRIQLTDILASLDSCRLMPDGDAQLREKILHRLSMHEEPLVPVPLPEEPSQDWPWDVLASATLPLPPQH